MISFIIIGYNEGWKLLKSVKRVYDIIDECSLTDAEVIYIDSQSSDNSMESLKEFKDLKKVVIKGHANAAIARNIGAEIAQGDWFFFIDGDMEIEKDFVLMTLDKNVPYEFFTGQVIDYIYDSNWKFINKQSHYKENKEVITVNSTGGVFLIRKTLWRKVNGMRNKYKRSQDLDFSLRLSELGHKVVRLPQAICAHHTIPHNNSLRMWKNIYNQNVFYQNSVLFRDHMFNMKFLKSYVRTNYSQIVLILALVSSLLISPFFFIAYLIVVLFRSYLNTTKVSEASIKYFFNRFSYHLVKDFLTIFHTLFFYPTNHKLEYEQIN